MNKYGQSIIEFVLIATLVILGIVFMGPYVLRSVNAHFKIWDDGVTDSFQEKIRQAPVGDLPPINVTCKCAPIAGGCGSNTAGSFCGAGSREEDWNCTPVGCNGANNQPICQQDFTCCSYASTGNCGQIPYPIVNGVINTSPHAWTPADPGPPPVDCYYGQMVWATGCTNYPPAPQTASQIECVADSNDCKPPACTGFILFQDSTYYCANNSTTAPTTGLDTNTPNNYVGNNAGSCPSSLDYTDICDVYCNYPFVLNPQGNGCAIEFTVAGVPGGALPTCPGPGCNDQSCPGPGCSLPNGWCVNSSTVITGAMAVQYGPTVAATPGLKSPSGQTNNGDPCSGGPKNPGEPGQTCAVSISF